MYKLHMDKGRKIERKQTKARGLSRTGGRDGQHMNERPRNVSRELIQLHRRKFERDVLQ